MAALTRRYFLQGMSETAALTLSGTLATPLHAKTTRPNILFILVDDMGCYDVGCYGQSKIRTPNIDRLATQGLRFTQAYAGDCICAPSRSVLMTGQHTGHTRVRGNFCLAGGHVGHKGKVAVRRANLTPKDVTVAQLLQAAGYHTGLVGKWHLDGYDPAAIPNNHGFDEFHGWLTQTETTQGYYPSQWYHNKELVDIPENKNGARRIYETDLSTNDATDFLKRNAKRPFYLYVAYNSPHSPVIAPDEGSYAQKPWIKDDRTYAAMIEKVDSAIGRVLGTLHDQGLDDNTLVIFASDNGPRSEPTEQLTQIANFFDSNGPLKGYKRDLYEGGIRAPLIARWPGQIQPGTTTDEPVYFADFLPTALELAGRPASPVDGTSFVPVLKGGHLKERYLYWETYEPEFGQAARRGNWKAIRKTWTTPIELYDLKADPSETQNVASKHPDIVREFDQYLRSAHIDSPEYFIGSHPHTPSE